MSNNHSKHNTMASHPESSMTSQSSTRIPKRVILAVVAAGIMSFCGVVVETASQTGSAHCRQSCQRTEMQCSTRCSSCLERSARRSSRSSQPSIRQCRDCQKGFRPERAHRSFSCWCSASCWFCLCSELCRAEMQKTECSNPLLYHHELPHRQHNSDAAGVLTSPLPLHFPASDFVSFSKTPVNFLSIIDRLKRTLYDYVINR